MSARSVTILFKNQSEYQLNLDKADLKKGRWAKNNTPPAAIPPKSECVWETHTFDGKDTFVKGEVKYIFDNDLGDISLSWKDPFIGSNVYRSSAPNGFEIKQEGGGGDHAVLRLTLLPVIDFQANSSEKRGFIAQ